MGAMAPAEASVFKGRLTLRTTGLKRRSKVPVHGLFYEANENFNLILVFYIISSWFILPDLPRQLEAAWNWSEACGNVDVMEQFTVTLSTALRLGLPFSQHFLCRLRQKGVIVDNMDTLVAAEDLCRPFQPQRGRRGRACQWRVNINRLPKGIERNKKRNGGTFRGFFRNVRKRGNLIGQIAFREKLV